jgi:predicted MPP superfamily phosphohydrolase
VGIVLLWGYLETWRVRVIETEFESPSVPETFNGYRIALIGGLHLRRTSAWTRKSQRILVDLEPDILRVAGNVKPSHKADNATVHRVLEEFLKPLEPRDGILCVRGYRDRKRFWEKPPKDSKMALLSNSHTTVEREGARICFLGTETAHATHLDRGINQVREAFSKIPSGAGMKILVAPSADFLRATQGLPLDLILAADNLHYQIRIPGWGVPRRDSKVPYSWTRGWIREGSLPLFLTLGLGVRWLPLRVFMRPEIALIKLRRPDCE